MKRILLAFLSLLFINSSFQEGTGEIYFVFGSDASLSGIKVDVLHPPYTYEHQKLYADPGYNAYKVMDPAFRNSHTDSYGTPVKMTWWMMGGNVYRYGSNKNIPLNSYMPLYLMKKYHMDSIEDFGDELSLHYHTWKWYDYNGDGVPYWNQTLQFEPCRDEFLQTMAEYLIDEDVYPVSFRSGWHWMDNGWQALIDSLFPFSMHAASPGRNIPGEEPIGNFYNWKRAPLEYVPWKVDPNDYQRPGNGKGWNLRSRYFSNSVRDAVEKMFAEAAAGKNQMVCFWSHITENDFVDNLDIALKDIEEVAANYPDVKFRYSTAIEAMQLWTETPDHKAPEVTFTTQDAGNLLKLVVETDEEIFQAQPFVAIKNNHEEYKVVNLSQVSPNRWETNDYFFRDKLAKAALAVTDTSGNLTKKYINFVPDDLYIDNFEEGYNEVYGNFSDVENSYRYNSWGTGFRLADIAPGDSAVIRWDIDVPSDTLYDMYIQIPKTFGDIPADIRFEHFADNNAAGPLQTKNIAEEAFVYAGSASFKESGGNYTLMTVKNNTGNNLEYPVDILKVTAIRRAKQLNLAEEFIRMGRVYYKDTLTYPFRVRNLGYEDLHVNSVSSMSGKIQVSGLPIEVPAHSVVDIPLKAVSWETGFVNDTLMIITDDPEKTIVKVPFTVNFTEYFKLVDNDDEGAYEETGTWYKSVTQAHGASSRYAFVNQGDVNTSLFATDIPKAGLYEINYLIPGSQNSCTGARYTFYSNGEELFHVDVNQNENGGVWTPLASVYLEEGTASVKTSLADETGGDVLRSDAVLFAYAGEKEFVYDDGNILNYSEKGTWHNSNSAAYGATSRYAEPIADTLPEASFSGLVHNSGFYSVYMIVPETENAVKQARYEVYVGKRLEDIIVLDQNEGSGDWVQLGTYEIHKGDSIFVNVENRDPNPGDAYLRTDAVKLSFERPTGVDEEKTVSEYSLSQNYPNPFNNQTAIEFSLREANPVTIKLYDILGREVKVITNKDYNEGRHVVRFNSSGLASGVYIYNITAGAFSASRKMVLLK